MASISGDWRTGSFLLSEQWDNRQRSHLCLALKCDRECRDGEGVPACVRACPIGALVYTEVDDYSGTRRSDVLGGR